MTTKKLAMEVEVLGEWLILDTVVNCDDEGFIVSLVDWSLCPITHPVLTDFYKKVDEETRAEFVKHVQATLIVRCDVFNAKHRHGLDAGREFMESVEEEKPVTEPIDSAETTTLNSDALNNEAASN